METVTGDGSVSCFHNYNFGMGRSMGGDIAKAVDAKLELDCLMSSPRIILSRLIVVELSV